MMHMITTICLDTKFKKRLEEYRREGGVTSFIARKAVNIINKLRCGEKVAYYQIARITRNGELRIKNCIKYDLGNGYRLVSLRQETCLIFIYIGTHEDCDRWLQRNQDRKYKINCSRNIVISNQKHADDIIRKKNDDYAEEYEKNIIAKIDEKTLRKIFSGICDK